MNISNFKAHGLTRREKVWGFGYLLFELILLSALLRWLNQLLPTPLPRAEVNFLFFIINLLAVLMIFGKYLRAQLRQLPELCWNVVFTTIPGIFVYFMVNILMGQLIFALDPQFTSINDAGIGQMAEENYALMFIGTVFFVPIAEECLFRGLVFRGLYDRNAILAWAVSVLLFAAIHVTGYIGSQPALTLLLCFVQYLPAGLCLAGAYRLSGSLISPILIHALVNLIGMISLR